MIFSYWFWTEYKNKIQNIYSVLSISIISLIISLIIINYSWASMMKTGDDDFLYSLIYVFYYSFFAITTEVGLGLLIAYALYQKIKGKQFFQMILLFPYITPAVMGGAVFFIIFGRAENSLLNEFIGFFGFDPQLWLFDKRPLSEILFGIKIKGFFAGPSLALTTSIIYGVWSYTGYYAIIVVAG